MKIRRFPGWVYRHGSEPDPRFSLANERTYLAWIRTAIALFAAGVALNALDLPMNAELRRVASGLFVLMGMLAAVESWVGWARTERALRQQTTLPGAVVSPVITVVVLVATGVVGIGLWL